MHRAYEKIIKTFECVADHVGIKLKAEEWRTSGRLLTGCFDWHIKNKKLSAARTQLTKLVRDAQALATPKDLTLTTSISEVEGGFSLFFQIDSDADLDQLVADGIIDKYCQEFANRYEYHLKTRRPKRSQTDLPDPSKSHGASSNRYPRPTKQFRTDVAPEISERVDAFRQATGISKREITEAALQAYLDQQEPS